MGVIDRAGERLDAVRRRAASRPPFSSLSKQGVPMDQTVMIVLLTVLHLLTAARPAELLTPLAAAAAGVVVDLLHDRLRGRPGFPGGAVITGLIVAGIVFPGDLSMAAGITALAMVLKHVVAVDGRNVFNPAALALYTGAVGLGTGLIWGIAGTPFVFVLGLVTVVWLDIWGVAASFLLTYWALTAVLTPATLLGAGTPLVSLLSGRPVFFAFVMVVEPVTSPNRSRSRIIYGVGVAVLAILLDVAAPILRPVAGPLFADTLLLALLVMNAAHRLVPDRWLA